MKYTIGDKYTYKGKEESASLLDFGFHPGLFDDDDYHQDRRVTIVGYDNDNIWYRPNVSSNPFVVSAEVVKKSINVFSDNFENTKPPYMIVLDQWYKHINKNRSMIYVVGFNMKHQKIWYRDTMCNKTVHCLQMPPGQFVREYVIDKNVEFVQQ